MSARIYGIKNCDTMKKAFDWLKHNDVAYDFHDYRAEGIDAGTVGGWVAQLGWEKVLNKASTTFKELPDAQKVDLDADSAHVQSLLNGEADQYKMDKRYIKPDGEIVRVRLKVGLIRTKDGAPDFFVSVIEEID